ncbi:hypothetical protein [Fischerella sp.]|jgi:hypothetical protein|uniref:hypothetical protein n=1 Tax=Fischerella sp. TaxID=1191 RepID=UPI0025B8685A|nr:hypothetical protein [Fischerella sp.]
MLSDTYPTLVNIDDRCQSFDVGASAGKTEVVQLLLEHHPNLELQNLDDFKVIDFSATLEVLRIIKNAVNYRKIG